VQARKSRGPQWDYNTQIYQIDRSSSDHYTHMSKPHSNTEFKVDPAEEGVRRGTANGHEHQTPGASSSSGPGDSGRAMRTPSTGNLGATPRSSVEVNGSQSQGRLPAHLQSMGQGQGYTPSLPISHLSQHQSHQHHQSQQPQHQHQSQLQQAQPQTQFQTTRLPHQSPPLQPQMYQNPQQARINPAQLAQLQLAQMGGLNPAMLQMARKAGSGGGGPGQNVNPASMGGINLASLSFSPGMNQAGAGGTAGAGVHGMPVMGGVNSLGQHNFAGGIGPGQGQGQGQMLGSGQGVQGPMLGGGWGEYTS